MRLTCLSTTTQRGHPSLLPCVRSTSCLIPLTSTSLLLAFSFLFICLLTALARSPFSFRFNYVSSPLFSDALLLNTVPARSPPPSHNNGLMPHPIVPLPWHPFAYCLDCHPVAPLHHRAITLLPHRTIALGPLTHHPPCHHQPPLQPMRKSASIKPLAPYTGQLDVPAFAISPSHTPTFVTVRAC